MQDCLFYFELKEKHKELTFNIPEKEAMIKEQQTITALIVFFLSQRQSKHFIVKRNNDRMVHK